MFKKVYPPNAKNCLVDALKNLTYSFNAIPINVQHYTNIYSMLYHIIV